MTDIPFRGSPAWIKWLIALVACAVLGLICLEILNRTATARWQGDGQDVDIHLQCTQHRKHFPQITAS